jgi:TetR/AcrR family transcriptional regulator, regulator of cefoperazone and chloramphenicol sensitivity
MNTQQMPAGSAGTGDGEVRTRILDAAIEQFGRDGFDTSLEAIAVAAGVDHALVIEHFGSVAGLREACDDYLLESIRASKSAALQSASPTEWMDQIARIEAYAPMMAYLVRSLESPGELVRAFMGEMIENAEHYMEDGVRAGTLKPSRDPRARAKFLALNGGGGFLLYLHMHPNPTDMPTVLRDYGLFRNQSASIRWARLPQCSSERSR